MASSPFLKYLLAFGGLIAGVMLLALALNAWVDPFWYFEGNRLGGVNYGFDERLGKANRLVARETPPDCLILGSSRVTLLDESRMQGFDCFNFSVSNGSLDEFESFARFAVSRGKLQPKLVVVGVDGFNFIDHGLNPTIPDFIQDLATPPGFWRKYFSIDSIEYSIRTLAGHSGRRRYYDERFRARVLDPGRAFAPPESVDPEDRFGGLLPGETNLAGPFTRDRSRDFRLLRESLRPARFVGYVPPIHRTYLEHLAENGQLDAYLQQIYRASGEFDLFLDFSVPSRLTSDRNATYDGSHFSELANAEVAEAILTGHSDVALRLTGNGFSDYRQAFRAALDRTRR